MKQSKKPFARANAMPEMALTIGLLFLLLFGGINMALLGYNQLQADGATYVAARAAAAHPTAPSAAASAVAAVFPNFNKSLITVQAPINGLVQATYSSTSPGLTLLGGNTGRFNVFARSAEASFTTTAPASTIAFTVGDSNGMTTLANYQGAYKVWLAQKLPMISSGCAGIKGTGGTCYDDSEFLAHCEAYANLKFTYTDKSNNPTENDAKDARNVEKTTKQSNWDPGTSGSHNATIYGWDASPHTYASPSGKSKAILGKGNATC